MDLKEAMANVIAKWPFYKGNYKEVKGKKEREKFFRIRHIAEHQLKSLLRLLILIESCEHSGVPISTEDLRELTQKFFENSLRLADVIGITAEDLLAKTEPLWSPSM